MFGIWDQTHFVSNNLDRAYNYTREPKHLLVLDNKHFLLSTNHTLSHSSVTRKPLHKKRPDERVSLKQDLGECYKQTFT